MNDELRQAVRDVLDTWDARLQVGMWAVIEEMEDLRAALANNSNAAPQDAKLDEIRKTLKLGMNIGKALREGINEDIAKDAARYRFMQGNESIKFWDGLGALHPSEWDEFIDAAMKEQKP